MEQTRGQVAKEQRRAHWRAVVEAAARSGLSVRSFCEQNGITEGHFHHWRHRLDLEDRAARQRRTPAKPEAASFALVRTGREEESAGTREIELLLDRGWRLRIPRGVDETTLGTVLATLAAAR